MKIRLSEVEIDIIKNICVTGSVTHDFAIDKSIGARRLRKLVEVGILERNKPHKEEVKTTGKRKKIKNFFSYSLGTKGKEFAIKEQFTKEIQGFNGYKHTETMQKVVDDLLNNKNIDIKNIMNEKEQKKFFRKELFQARRNKIDFAINDIAYYDKNNQLHSIEIETDYRKGLIKKHKNYAQKVLGVKYEFIKGGA